MDEHARMEADLSIAASTEEGGFIGLQVSEQPPHTIRTVDDLVDVNFLRHDQPGYSNPRIIPGDRILQVDGVNAENVQNVSELHKMLTGPLHSVVTLSMARAESGERYSVSAIRHGFHSFDKGSYDHAAAGASVREERGSESLYDSRRSASNIYLSQRSDSDFLNLYGSQRSAAGRHVAAVASPTMGYPARASPGSSTDRSRAENGVIVSNPAPTNRVF